MRGKAIAESILSSANEGSCTAHHLTQGLLRREPPYSMWEQINNQFYEQLRYSKEIYDQICNKGTKT